ncbi:aldose 1-epimerase [Acidiplasma sp.]|uniref:aldose 1-epimerase n=1 Tax=Acidiplasma sp. TaxID=1872114 RepID=UPI0025827C18|nr:aldose 1-epimerase [Acidiplasma sp.]
MKISYNNSYAALNNSGAYLHDLYLNGTPILMPSTDNIDTHGGSAVLFPFGNRIRDGEYEYKNQLYKLPKNDGNNSIHGLIRDFNFEYDADNKNEITFSGIFQHPGYPGRAQIKINYVISQNKFITNFYVKSLDLQIPVEVGFHPYFLVSGRYTLNYNGKLKMMNYMDTYFPDGTYTDFDLNDHDLSSYSLDNAFKLHGDIKLIYDDHEIRIHRKNMDYIVLYNGRYASGKSIAIEPMTGAPDVYHNKIGLINLKKDEIFECGYEIELLK